MTNEKLIEEARKYVSDHDAYADNHLLRDLANALEAAEKHQGEPSDPNEHTPACDAWADMNGSGCTCHVEQGEPSDAQVRAACQTFAATEWDVSTFEAMRAALRAAGKVR